MSGGVVSVLLIRIKNCFGKLLSGPIAGNPNIPMAAGRPITFYPMTATARCSPIAISVHIVSTTHFPTTINPYMAGRRSDRAYYNRGCRTYFNYYLCRRSNRKSNYEGCG
jgi:hypothetical protein